MTQDSNNVAADNGPVNLWFNGGNIMDVTVTLTVNGIERTITTHPARPLLESCT
jgi:hypothetical protein